MGQGILSEIAERVGTPVYVYDAAAITARYSRLAASLAGLPHQIHFAVKANSNLAVLALLRRLGAGADIVSAGELARVLQAGFDPGDVVFSGAGKTVDELKAALGAGVGLVNIESAREVEHLARLAEGDGRTQGVAIRVNPDVHAPTHPYTRTGELGMKFGIPHGEVPAAARAVAAAPRLRLAGLAMHIGSQIMEVEPFGEATRRLIRLADGLRGEGHTELRRLDLGGGLGVPYAGEAELDLARYVREVATPVARAGFTVAVEPGRYLVAHAGVLLTRALYRKQSGRRCLAIVDAGMTELLRPSHYDAHHEVTVLARDAEERQRELVDVVGPACETGDFLALERMLPQIREGDLLAIHTVGAYGFVMSSNYNGRPRPAEVLRDGDRWAVVRAREPVSSLAAGEVVDPVWWTEAPDA